MPLVREQTIIGRLDDCHIRIPKGGVSRKHCEIVVKDGSIIVSDLGFRSVDGGSGTDTLRWDVTDGARIDTEAISPVRDIERIDLVVGSVDQTLHISPSFVRRSTDSINTLIIDGDRTSTINTYILDGRLTAVSMLIAFAAVWVGGQLASGRKESARSPSPGRISETDRKPASALLLRFSCES